MKGVWQKFFVFFCVLFVFFITFAQAQSGDFSGQSFEGFDLVGYGEEGEKKWDLKGETAIINGNQIEIINVDANAYGQEDMNVKARTGQVNKDSGYMHLQGDVVLTTETGTRMLTDSLEWQKDKDLITTEDTVVILRDMMKASGRGADAHPGLKTAKLKEDVKVEYERLDENVLDGVITVTCTGPMEIDYENQSAVFYENVIVIDGDRQLMADQVKLFFDPETQEIKEIICLGNVLIVQGDSASYSEKAIYKAVERKVILSGRPKLLMHVQGQR